MHLYILQCNDGSLYTGVTTNLESRLSQHETGYYTTCYTYNKRPVTLVYSEYFPDYNLAFEWESKIKRWSKAKKLALISGDFDNLIKLSKKDFSK